MTRVDFRTDELQQDGIKLMNFFACKDINFIKIEKIDILPAVRVNFQKIMNTRATVFLNPDEALSYNTNNVATIRMGDDTPVYLKLYPYPVDVRDFVNVKVKQLLENRIFRPSRSCYNSLLWVVANIMVILSKLGKVNCFTIHDLKSGCHQIELADRYRENGVVCE